MGVTINVLWNKKMAKSSNSEYSSGIPALDEILRNIIPGDNVVFQVETLEEYIPFVYIPLEIKRICYIYIKSILC